MELKQRKGTKGGIGGKKAWETGKDAYKRLERAGRGRPDVQQKENHRWERKLANQTQRGGRRGKRAEGDRQKLKVVLRRKKEE